MSTDPARAGPVITELIDPRSFETAAAHRYVSIPVALGCFVTGGAIIGLIILGADVDTAVAWFGILAYTAIAAPLFLAATLSRVQQRASSYERCVSYENGTVALTTPGGRVAHALHQCCWFHGRARDDRSLAYHPIRQSAILLVFPSGQVVACGMSEPYRSKWRDLLESSRCRKVLRQEGWLGFVVLAAIVFGLVGGGFIGWQIGAFLRDTLLPRLGINNRLDNVLPACMAIGLAWLGAVSPYFMLPGWQRNTESERAQLVRWAVLFPAKVSILLGVLIGGNLASRLLLVALFTAVFLAICWHLRRTRQDS